MVIYLIVLAILAFAFLVMMFINYRRVGQSGLPERFKGLRILVTWLLIFVMVGSVGGAAYAATHNGNKTETKVVKKATKKSSSASMNEKLGVTFSKKSPTIGADGTVSVKMYVPSKTSVKIIGHNSRTVYKTFAAGTKNKTQTFKYTFKDAGTYDVELSRGETTTTKTIEVKSAESASSSSSEESATTATSTTTSNSNGISSYYYSGDSYDDQSGSYTGGGSDDNAGGTTTDNNEGNSDGNSGDDGSGGDDNNGSNEISSPSDGAKELSF